METAGETKFLPREKIGTKEEGKQGRQEIHWTDEKRKRVRAREKQPTQRMF